MEDAAAAGPEEAAAAGAGQHPRQPPSLENVALEKYLEYLETESVSYLELMHTRSKYLAGLAPKLLGVLKRQLSGVSWVMRERMLERILSAAFPSAKHCRLAGLRKKVKAAAAESGRVFVRPI